MMIKKKKQILTQKSQRFFANNARVIFRLITFFILAGHLFICSCDKDKDDSPVDLTSGTYSGTGAPLLISNAAPASWSGKLLVNDDNDDGDIFYSITNWANKSLIYLNNKNGKIYLDLETVLFEYDDLYWCLGVGYFERENFYCSPTSYDFEVKYDSKNKSLNFKGSIEGNPAVVGIVGRDKTTGAGVAFAGETFYGDAVLVLR